jgi:hypothetical protein
MPKNAARGMLDERDGRDEVGIQSVHVAPFSYVSASRDTACGAGGLFQYPAAAPSIECGNRQERQAVALAIVEKAKPV